MLSDCQGRKAVSWIRPYAVIVNGEFQKVLSFSWNCEVMVGSARSHSATRPSYFGPNSPKFNSSGLAAWAADPKAKRPPDTKTAKAATRPSDFRGVNRFRMGFRRSANVWDG